MTFLLVVALDRDLPLLLVLQKRILLFFFALFPTEKSAECRAGQCGPSPARQLMDSGGLWAAQGSDEEEKDELLAVPTQLRTPAQWARLRELIGASSQARSRRNFLVVPHFHAPLVFGYGDVGLDALSFSVGSSCVFCRIAVVVALVTVAHAVWFGWLPLACGYSTAWLDSGYLFIRPSTVVFFEPVYLTVTCSVLVLPEVCRIMV